MGAQQEQVERAVADQFFGWFNAKQGTGYMFARRAGEAPDFVYVWNGRELMVEITAGYYDGSHAAFIWEDIRKPDREPASLIVINPDESLAKAVLKRITEKSLMRYGSNTVLLVYVPPGMTSVEELSQLLAKEALPTNIPFLGVYVCGRFPMTSSSSGGYRVLTIKEMSDH